MTNVTAFYFARLLRCRCRNFDRGGLHQKDRNTILHGKWPTLIPFSDFRPVNEICVDEVKYGCKVKYWTGMRANSFIYIYTRTRVANRARARAYTCVDGPTRIRDINGNGFVLPMRADSGEVDLG